jgi:hypothetical protein
MINERMVFIHSPIQHSSLNIRHCRTENFPHLKKRFGAMTDRVFLIRRQLSQGLP